MKTAAAEALAYFNNGLNCAQTVLSAFCEEYGLSKEFAYRLANGLGSGCRSGEVCGALTGAILVIGLKYGQNTIDDLEAKMSCHTKIEEFIRSFQQQNGSIICRDLLGCDVSTKEGLEAAKEKNLFSTICVEKIKNAITMLEDLGY
jgi:C_GCAxxG_C_C family probable redox protein